MRRSGATATRRPRWLVAGAAALAATLFAGSAHAVLGGAVASVHDDRARLKATILAARPLAAGTTVHEMVLADGSSIREHVNADGVVFAVSWSTRFKPDLAALLGSHAAGYALAASQAMGRAGVRHQATLQRDDLVVHATAHLNAHVGVAYLRSLVPDGVRPDALR